MKCIEIIDIYSTRIFIVETMPNGPLETFRAHRTELVYDVFLYFDASYINSRNADAFNYLSSYLNSYPNLKIRVI